MEVCKVIGFVIIVHLVAISQCASIDNREDIKEWQNHNARLQNFKCSSPQPRSLRLDEVAIDSNLEDINHMEVFPTLTVLHRCDSQAGCCNSIQHTCGPKTTEQVTLTFKVIPRKLSHSRHVIRHNKSYVHVTAVNHTECYCSLNSNHPKK